MERHKALVAACDILTPAKIPVVDTLKSKYASTSGEGGLKMLATFFFGMSSVSRMVGQVLTSTAAAASLDLSSRVMACVLRTHADLLTYITWSKSPSKL